MQLWVQSIVRHGSETDGCSGGCQHCTNLHVLFSLQRSLGLIASDSRQWSTRTPGYMWQTSMAHEACGQRRRHLTGQCHWRPLNGRWEGVSMWGSYQWRDQVRLRENLSEKNKTYNIKLLKNFILPTRPGWLIPESMCTNSAMKGSVRICAL